jgi:putative acetyltransferase
VAIDVAEDDPRADDVRALLEVHLGFSRSATPAEYSFALDVDRLAGPDVTFFSARDAGRLIGIAALRRLDDRHAELKSMHTRETDRGHGAGRALVNHIVEFAWTSGYRRLSLETGTTEEFAPARALYAKSGFVPCEPFGDYRASAYNTFMTMDLELARTPSD